MNITKLLLITLCCIGISGNVDITEAATSGSHYSVGIEGVQAGNGPPPGYHYRVYTVWTNPTTLMDDNGDKKAVDVDLDVFAQAHRFIHVTQRKLFGADWAYNVIVPICSKDFDLSVGGTSLSKGSHGLSVGDIVIEPMVLFWHKDRWDGALGTALIAPTGEYDADKAVNPGFGYWSGQLSLGGTYYLDAGKSWSVSAVSRYLIHTKQQDTDVRPGDEFLFEGGVGKSIKATDTLMLRPGISFTGYWQVSDDSKDNSAYSIVADERKESHSAGLELNVFHLPSLIQCNLRVLREFDAENTTEGSQIVFTLTKSFM